MFKTITLAASLALLSTAAMAEGWKVTLSTFSVFTTGDVAQSSTPMGGPWVCHAAAEAYLAKSAFDDTIWHAEATCTARKEYTSSKEK